MKRGRMAAALTAGLVVSATVAGAPAGAGEPTPTGTITVDPPIGRPGTPFTFSGEGCVSERGPGVMEVFVYFEGDFIYAEDPGFVTVKADGSWAVGTVPNGFVADREAGGLWEVRAFCFDAETAEQLVGYEPATFEVVAPSAPPTTAPPTIPPSTPPTAPAEPEPAKPATPVAAHPDFTG